MLAEYAGLASRTFKRRFKLATYETPISYLQKISVAYVKVKLQSSTGPINKIIWSAGYKDISSFR